MNLDVRIPMGLMFGILGAMLALFGLFSDPSIYRRSLGINVNFWWGISLFAFGLAMILLGWNRRRG